MKFGVTRSIVLSSAILSFGLLGGCATTASQTNQPASKPTNTAKQSAAQAIAAAKSAYKEAEAKGFAWTPTGPLIGKAESAYKAGHYAKATSLANKAKAQADGSINQYYVAIGTRQLKRLEGMRGMMSSAQLKQLKQARHLYRDSKGKPLYDLTSQMLTEMKNAKRTSVTVSKGDTLWGIAGMSMVYGNPYEWPLIYKANANKIHDPDLIYPGENLSINQDPGQAAVSAAIDHAKHRGAWTLGQPTSGDLKYLHGGK